MQKSLSQVVKIYKILSDGKPHRFDEIQQELFGGTKYGAFRLGARIFDIKKEYGVDIIGHKDKNNPALYWYQLTTKQEQASMIDNTYKLSTQFINNENT